MRILKENTVAVIIDFQEKLFPHMYDNEKILEKNMNILIEGLNILEIPIIVTEQYTKGLGFTILSVSESLRDYSAIEKSAFSCCDDTEFVKKLVNYKPVHVLVAGIEAHVCVQQTAVDLLHKGYIPVIVADCVSSRKPFDKQLALGRMKDEGAIITSYESVLFELLRYSDAEHFKAISRLIK